MYSDENLFFYSFWMLPVSADDQAVGEDVVREDHEAEDSDNEELEIAGQKGYHKTSHGDMKDIEHPPFELFGKFDKFFGWKEPSKMVLFQDFDLNTLHIFAAADKVVVDGGWPGQHHGGEDDAGGPVHLEGGLGVLHVPGHHHDAGLEDQLTRGLGQGPQAGQHSMSDDHI